MMNQAHQIGIECKKCGRIIYRLSTFQRLCKQCGAEIIDVSGNSLALGKYGRGVVIKVIRTTFCETYEKVRDY